MPHWCANRLYIKGSKESIAEVKKLMLGEIPLYFEEAIRKSIKFFIAGHAGILKSVPSFNQEQNQANDQKQSVGDVNTTADLAFTKWFSRLVLDCPLSKKVCEEIVQLYNESGLANCSIASLSASQVQIINQIFDKQCFDWFGDIDYDLRDIEKYWKMLDECNTSSVSTFDMRLLIAPKIFPAIVGSNGHYFSNYGGRMNLGFVNQELYGVRTPKGINLKLIDISYDELPGIPQGVRKLLAPTDKAGNEAYIMVDFDTVNSKPKRSVFDALSKQYDCSFAYFYCEPVSKACGYDIYQDGHAVNFDYGHLQLSEPSDDIFRDVVGPDYIIHNVAHYGG